jgi:hypothetical protein
MAIDLFARFQFCAACVCGAALWAARPWSFPTRALGRGLIRMNRVMNPDSEAARESKLGALAASVEPAEQSTLPPTNLGAESDRFVGRVDELTSLGKLIEGSTLVTIVGMGGNWKNQDIQSFFPRVLEEDPAARWGVVLRCLRGLYDHRRARCSR